MFIGTGEHTQDLERFEPRPFISKLLGMGDVGGLMEKVREAGMADPAKQETMRKKLEAGGAFTLRDMRDQLTNVSKLCARSRLA
jgi:signal recognition particle subunit SRP54